MSVRIATSIRKIFVCALVLMFVHVHFALCCDNTMLELITGSSAQESVSASLLVISSKMQVTATVAQAFNHAAAEAKHQEVMESWLYIASQITSNPPGHAGEDPDFHETIVSISRDLGNIRQQLLQRQLDDVHDCLEICVSRLSLLAAMINDHQLMKDFLRFELLTLGLRPIVSDFASCKKAILAVDYGAAINKLVLPGSTEIAMRISALEITFAALHKNVEIETETFGRATLTAYRAFYNEFAALKMLLLAEKYFNSRP